MALAKKTTFDVITIEVWKTTSTVKATSAEEAKALVLDGGFEVNSELMTANVTSCTIHTKEAA
jgi:hypothetical protein